MKNPLRLVLSASVCFLLPAGCETSAGSNPEAVGKVAWGRDLDAALASSKKTGKPVFVLFQEVPGCAGCRQFGRDVLSDPKVVSRIQEKFTPLLIHNNSGGKDAEILAKYHEPAWNYQVVRFLDAKGQDLIPRKDHVWESPELMKRMDAALAKAGPPVAAKPAAMQRVAFAQYCFWTGEMKLGGIDGVKRTEAGYLGGREVTLVDFDPAKISLGDLTRKAEAAGVADAVHTSLDGYRAAPASDQKRQIQGTKYSKMKLTPEQATKVNAFARTEPAKAEAYFAE